MKTISIVIPAYNEEECIDALIERVRSIMEPLNYNFELIIVDDGSRDRTFAIIKERAKDMPFLKGIRLSRNMGHQAALDCGLKHASGDAVISMDADLQHPPEIVPEMIKKWEEGYEIVTTQKMENEDTGLIYKVWAKFFYSFFNRFSQIKLTPNASDFRLMGRKSMDALLQMPEYHKFFRGMVPFIGFQSYNLPFITQKRHAGTRKYTFRQSLRLASDGLFSFSDFALKIPFYFGGILFIVMIIYLLYALFRLVFLNDILVQGWASVIAINIISISIQLIFMGIIGIYIGKIYFEVKKRPTFFTDEKIGNLKQI